MRQLFHTFATHESLGILKRVRLQVRVLAYVASAAIVARRSTPFTRQRRFFAAEIQSSLGGGVSVGGRIDLVYQRATKETSIVDPKSTERAQPEDVTETQLHIYALGYEERTGRRADYVEIWELDEEKKKPRAVDDDLLDNVKMPVKGAANALRENAMPAQPETTKCSKCDYKSMCTAGRTATKSAP